MIGGIRLLISLGERSQMDRFYAARQVIEVRALFKDCRAFRRCRRASRDLACFDHRIGQDLVEGKRRYAPKACLYAKLDCRRKAFLARAKPTLRRTSRASVVGSPGA